MPAVRKAAQPASLADPAEIVVAVAFVVAVGAAELAVEVEYELFEVAAGEVLVGDDDLSGTRAAFREFRSEDPFRRGGGGQLVAAGHPIRSAEHVQPETQNQRECDAHQR